MRSQSRDEYGNPVQAQNLSYLATFRNQNGLQLEIQSSPLRGYVKSVWMREQGSSCQTNGTLVSDRGSGGGTGFRATFEVSGGAIVNISIVSGGYGYISRP